mgnify:FL=1|jgi:hypothetical protein|tara:strand:+ start:96 stop:416 length:321 start_codon:yes stop_codon:yes gene_type:complete
MASIFRTATQARTDTRNNSVIHSEVRGIETVVLANIDAGVLYANVTTGTTMTTGNAYYKVYYGITTDATKTDQINYVQKYFKDLGYGVTIKQKAGDEQVLTWNISW